MLLRQLEYLVALARERHFARAADACFVSPPRCRPASASWNASWTCRSCGGAGASRG
ncbi:LysR family transcriptional regulator [Streptomyces sp. PA03-1a]|nr:LysR family transcriptional regulator [Streptomyces sp. PA03-1a]MDX2811817.1 LysR family transcriptional regulator [Streptomyces sp. PA03-5A]